MVILFSLIDAISLCAPAVDRPCPGPALGGDFGCALEFTVLAGGPVHPPASAPDV
jgi:hypothetical protein